MQIFSKIFLLLFLTTYGLVAQDQIAVDKIIGPTTGRVQIETHIEMPNNSIIFGTDSAGDERRLLYWDNSNDLYVGPEVGIGALASGGDVIIRGVAATNTVVGIEFDAKGASANSAVFAPLSGDSVELGSPTNPFSFTYVQDVLQLLDDGVSGGLVPTFTLEADTSAGGATKLRSSATSSFFLYLPASLPASTECLEVTSGGQIQASGAGCGGSGSASSGTNDEIQITDNAGGFTSVANFRHDSTVSHPSLNLPLHITFQTDSGFDIGQGGVSGNRADEIWGDNMYTEDLFIQRQGAAGHLFLFQPNATQAILDLKNAASSTIWSWNVLNGDVYSSLDVLPNGSNTYNLGDASQRWEDFYVDDAFIYEGLLPDANEGANIGSTSLFFDNLYIDDIEVDNDILPDTTLTSQIGSSTLVFLNGYIDSLYPRSGGGGTLGTSGREYGNIHGGIMVTTTLSQPKTTLGANLGSPSFIWDELYIDNVDVYTDLMPDSNGGAVIGGSSLRFSTVYSQSFNADGSGQLGDAVSDAWTIFIGSSGNFYIRDTGGASTSISCSGVSDGWMAVTNDNYIVWCDGATRYRIAGASF